MKQKCFLLAAACLSLSSLSAQIGGRHVYDFLNIPATARLAALGGTNVSILDEDLALSTQNPALANPEMHQRASFGFLNYLSDLRNGYGGYAHDAGKLGTLFGGVQYLSAGKMRGADEFGNLTGTFTAAEWALSLGLARSWRTFRYGASLKTIQSTLGPGFNSWGMALDLGAAYRSKDELFSAGLSLRNLGLQLSTYTGAAREPLPFEVVAGVSNRLRYMPMRFSVTLTHLDQPRLIYRDPNPVQEFDLAGNPIPQRSQLADQAARHVVAAAEFYIGNLMRLRAGYNHLRRQELRARNRAGMTGFSLGAGIRGSRFALDYSFSAYGVTNDFHAHQWSLSLALARPQPESAPALNP